jgi:hypothetical protein
MTVYGSVRKEEQVMQLQNSQASPSLATFNNQLWVAFLGKSSNNIDVCSSDDGLNWSTLTEVGQTSKNPPSLCAFNNKLWLAFRGDTSNDVLVCSYDGHSWSSSISVGQTTTAAPSLAVFQGKLYVAFLAANSSNDILLCSSSDGQSWSGNVPVPNQSSGLAPAIAGFNGRLWLAYIAQNGSNDIFVFSSADAKTWNAAAPNQKSFAAPSLAVHGSALFMAFTGNTSSDVLVCSNNGNQWSADTAVPSQTSQTGPSVAEFNGHLEIAFLSADTSDRLFIVSSSDGVKWSPAFQIGNYPTQIGPLGANDVGFGSTINNANFSATVTMNSDGTCTFSGTYNNTGEIPGPIDAFAQSYSVACVVLLADGTTAYTFQQQAECQNAKQSSWNTTTKNATVAANWPTLAGVGVNFQFKANNTAPPGGFLDAIGDALQSLLGDAETVAQFVGQVIEVIGPALSAAAG